MHRDRSRLLAWVATIGAVLIYLKVVMGRSFLSSTYYIGQNGDAKQDQWYIGWVWHALTHHLPIFVTYAFDYPHATNIMDFTSISLLGLLFGWLYPLAGVVVTFNVIFIVNSLLIAIFGKLMLERLGIGLLFSSIGGCLFVLLPYLVSKELSQMDHYFVALHFIAGYLIASQLTASRALRWWDGLLLGVVLAAIFYISQETFLSFFVFLGMLVACAAAIDWRRLRAVAVAVVRPPYLVSIGLGLLLVIPGLVNYLSGLPHEPLVNPGAPYLYVNDLVSFVIPSHIYLLHPGDATMFYSHFSGNLTEWSGYLSLPVIALFVAGVVLNWEQKHVRLFFFGGLVMLIFSLGPRLHVDGAPSIPLPWAALMRLPFLGYLLPGRFAFYTQCCVVIVLAIAADGYHTRIRLLQSKVPLALNLAALLLVALFWLPALPYATTDYPAAASILAQPSVADAFLKGKDVLFLQHNKNLSDIMGLLADSGNYDVTMPNVYGNVIAESAYPTILSTTYTAGDLNVYGGYLEAMLPSLHVDEVAYVAADGNDPLSPDMIAETSAILGAPVLLSDHLVAIWRVPAIIKTDKLTYPLDVLYQAVAAFVRSASGQPVTVPLLVQKGLLPASFLSSPRAPDPHLTSFGAWVGQQAPGTVTLSVYANELTAQAMVAKYGQQASAVGYSSSIADASAASPPAQVIPGSAFQFLTLTFALQSLKISSPTDA
jgi:hypothetical protein